ncbi:hypothetical protein JXQ70_19120 [bacterium]|nr:hypothetical protein [bacterium]
MEQKETLTGLRIFRFWLPLALTWLMMAVEGPFLAAIIARTAEPKYNLAAYGVAFAFAMLVESPIIMMLSASTALVRDRQSYYKLRNYCFGLNFLITLVMLLLIVPAVFDQIALTLLRLPEQVADLTRVSLLYLIPWPAAIGFRRFYQGILIRNNLTSYVAYGTSARLITILMTAMFLFFFTSLEGAYVGAISLALAVMLEAIATRLMAARVIKKLVGPSDETGKHLPLSYNGIHNFYFPLVLTSVLMIGVGPMTTFFLGWGRHALESLAVMPVINSLVFIFRSSAVSYQEVVIALLDRQYQNFLALQKFARHLAWILFIGIALFAFTPLSGIWFQSISGLSPELVRFARLPMIILVLIPGLTVLLSMQRALLVVERQTSMITVATLIELIGIAIVLFVLISWFDVIGATAAAFALTIGRLFANVSLVKPCRTAITRLEHAAS